MLNTIPVLLSKTFNSQVLEITTLIFLPSSSLLLTVLNLLFQLNHQILTDQLFSSEIFPAIPPTWKVLKVN